MTEVENQPNPVVNSATDVPDTNQPANPQSKFSIGSDVKTFNRKEFTPRIHSAFLTAVTTVIRKVQDEDKVCIEFAFADADGRQYNHLEWPIDELDAKFDTKFKGLSERVNHMAATLCGGAPVAGTFSGNTMTEFFNSIVSWFNITDEKGKTKWAGKEFWIKLVYSGKNLNFPLSPNFIDPVRIVNGAKKQTTLTWNPKYDKDMPTGSSFNAVDSFSPYAGGGDNLPPVEI